MAGHSKFANIKHRKGAQDAKRAKIFTKLGREIVVAVKESGDDPTANPRLRTALSAARVQNMPKDRIETAIKKGSGAGTDADNFEEARYEGYGPGGVAVMVDALTDNRNRTAGEVRSIFSKNGGNLGESGSVAFSFERVGEITYNISVATEDEIMEAAIDAGASDVQTLEESHIIYSAPDDFSTVRDNLMEKFGDIENGRLSWKPTNFSEINEDQARTLLKLIDALEDSDDVQHVVANYDISDEIAQKLAEEG